METVVVDDTPLSDYLKDEGKEGFQSIGTKGQREDINRSRSPSPNEGLSFAPTGRPLVRKRFRNNTPKALQLHIPRNGRISSLSEKYSKAVVSRIDRAETSKFLEQFRYTIVASQLLSGHSNLPQQHLPRQHADGAQPGSSGRGYTPTAAGVALAVVGALTVAWIANWIYWGGISQLTRKRLFGSLVLLIVVALFSHAYIRQQWLRYLRKQALCEIAVFVEASQDFDSASGAALSLIQEVELVSRGYRLSAPLPPISRMEDRSQTRRCNRLRNALAGGFKELIQRYAHVTSIAKSFSEQLDLEKYFDIYDISDLDIADAKQGFSEDEFDDPHSMRALKIATARFHTLRKIFLCALLALECKGDDSDFLRWSSVVEGLRVLSRLTKVSYETLRNILGEEETFPSVAPAKAPLSPGRERWRSQLRKLNSLSSGIRGLQAKMTLLREESDRALNDAEDISELGPSLMAQYESIGEDLRLLMQAWEDGRVALASGIDRNEKRLSSMSMLLSPTTSLSGITSVEDGGGTLDAFKALTGFSPPSSVIGTPPEPEQEEVFEAVALPRPRSTLTREERISKMKEDREKREAAREKTEASRGMLRELETVIKLRPKGRTNPRFSL
ncbi:hypothetical protein VTK73DRAFT_9482 [Phialemonium thermophilum]|uniref:Vezatin n=1 Tax=Phialemonium thermophilum TaxID=223376 RepID=A0ABR3Y5A1_9PEZI